MARACRLWTREYGSALHWTYQVRTCAWHEVVCACGRACTHALLRIGRDAPGIMYAAAWQRHIAVSPSCIYLVCVVLQMRTRGQRGARYESVCFQLAKRCAHTVVLRQQPARKHVGQSHALEANSPSRVSKSPCAACAGAPQRWQPPALCLHWLVILAAAHPCIDSIRSGHNIQHQTRAHSADAICEPLC